MISRVLFFEPQDDIDKMRMKKRKININLCLSIDMKTPLSSRVCDRLLLILLYHGILGNH